MALIEGCPHAIMRGFTYLLEPLMEPTPDMTYGHPSIKDTIPKLSLARACETITEFEA